MAANVRWGYPNDAIWLQGDETSNDLTVEMLNHAVTMIPSANQLDFDRLHLSPSLTCQLFDLIKRRSSSKWKCVRFLDCFGTSVFDVIKTIAFEHSEMVFARCISTSNLTQEAKMSQLGSFIQWSKSGSELYIFLFQRKVQDLSELQLWAIHTAKTDHRIQELRLALKDISQHAGDLFCDLLSSRPCWKRLTFRSCVGPHFARLLTLSLQRCKEVAFETFYFEDDA